MTGSRPSHPPTLTRMRVCLAVLALHDENIGIPQPRATRLTNRLRPRAALINVATPPLF